MTEWVALLRGVNVGGATVRSADLVQLFASLGMTDARAVLASGNVAFHADEAASGRAELKKRIESALRERFEYDAWIVLVTAAEVRAAIEAFPFDETDAARQPWVIFCVDDATRDELIAAAAGLDDGVDPVAAGPGVVYWSPPKGSSTDTAFAKVLAKKSYRPRTTNRNLRTLRRIVG